MSCHVMKLALNSMTHDVTVCYMMMTILTTILHFTVYVLVGLVYPQVLIVAFDHC